MAEAFEAFGFDQLLEDGDLAFAGEGDFLVAAFDAFLDPRLFGRVGDVHVLDADIAAIGAADNGQYLAQGGVFQAKDAINEDRTVHVGVGEPPVAGVQFRIVALGLETERIEVRLQMAAYAEGADQHQGADRIARGRLRGGGRSSRIGERDRLFDLGGDRRPETVHGADQVVARRRQVGGPGARLGIGPDHVGPVHQAVEEGAPFGRHGGGIGGPFLLHHFDEHRIGAIEERGFRENLI